MIETAGYRRMMSRMMRSYGNRVSDDVAELGGMADFVAEAEETLKETVHRLRSVEGGSHSWSDIGRALGITRQAAQKRFGGEGARVVGGQPVHLR